MKQLTLIALLALIFVSTSFQIKNINHQLQVENSQDYVQYIKALKGLSTQEDLSSNVILSNIVQNERISLLNPVEDIVLILVDQIKDNSESLPSLEDIKNVQEMEDIIGGFDMMSLVNFDDESINRKIKEMQEVGKIVHTIEISEGLAKQFESHVQRKLIQTAKKQSVFEEPESTIHKPKTAPKVSQTPVKSSSYILKFFFSLLFIVISLGSLAAIANMDNKKDTLLYAKFIADVGAR